MGDRWTLVLVRQLLPSPRGFQELRIRTGIAPRVLSSRLRALVAAGFVRSVAEGSRSVYDLTEQGRSLEPIVHAIGRWWIQRGVDDLGIDAGRFTETSAQSVLEALPFMVREGVRPRRRCDLRDSPEGARWWSLVRPPARRTVRSDVGLRRARRCSLHGRRFPLVWHCPGPRGCPAMPFAAVS